MSRVLSLDSGHLTDAELGINASLDRMMRDRPAPANARVVITPNGNVVTPQAR